MFHARRYAHTISTLARGERVSVSRRTGEGSLARTRSRRVLRNQKPSGRHLCAVISCRPKEVPTVTTALTVATPAVGRLPFDDSAESGK